jgi:hypothetical protein
MKIVIVTQALFDDGEVAWNYSHEENVVGKTADVDSHELVAAMKRGEPPPKEVQDAMALANSQSAGETLERLLEQLDLARASILQQAAADMTGGGATSDEAPGP